MLDPKQLPALDRVRPTSWITSGETWTEADAEAAKARYLTAQTRPAATVYNARRARWRRYLKTMLTVAILATIGTWALAQAVTWAVDTFLLTEVTP